AFDNIIDPVFQNLDSELGFVKAFSLVLRVLWLVEQPSQSILCQHPAIKIILSQIMKPRMVK
ncbi:unnamed protein product, partial [Symbiodinium pilosum]